MARKKGTGRRIPLNGKMPGISSQDKLSMVVCPGGEKVSMSDGAVRHPMQGKKLRPY